MKLKKITLGAVLDAVLKVSILGVLVILALILFFPFNVGSINKILIQNEVQAGNQIIYNVDFCRNLGKGVKTETERFLIPEDPKLTNAIELSSSPNKETLDGITGCRTTAEPIKLPVGIEVPEGDYRLRIRVDYCIFPGRCIPVEGSSEPFKISKPSIPNQLTVISEQLKGIEQVINKGAVGNVIIPQSINMPRQPAFITQPTQDSQPTPQPIAPAEQQPAEQPGLIRNITDGLDGLIERILWLSIPKHQRLQS